MVQQDFKAGSQDSIYAKAHLAELLNMFSSSVMGLSEKEAKKRLSLYGLNQIAKKKKRKVVSQILSKFLNPLIIVLIIIVVISLILRDTISGLMVFIMILVSVVLDFFQEYKSGREAEKLSEMVKATATVFRNGRKKEVKIKEIVPGDIVDLSAGDMVPADLRIISCKDLFINQASLTGESSPVEKFGKPIEAKGNSIHEMSNIAYMGTSVVTGTGIGIVVRTGTNTRFGELSKRLLKAGVETSFDRGIKDYTWLMIRFTVFLTFIIFLINACAKKDYLQALLFSLAVAVGLTPEMLPMLVTVNLSKGAIAMSKKQVIVKKLNSIQNFGAMNVLCTDKTGTLTLGEVVLERYCDVNGRENEDVLRLAYINSFYQTGLKNLLDKAILKKKVEHVQAYNKVDEIPYDFSRKIMSVVVEMEGSHRLITKGAPEYIFPKCTKYEINGRIYDINERLFPKLIQQYNQLSSEGFRVLALAYKDNPKKKDVYSKKDESDLILKGYTAFLDPPKPTAKKTIAELKELGINIKVLTGDNELVTKNICTQVGISAKGMITGDAIDKLEDKELQKIVKETCVFTRLSPLQKERVIRALRKNGNTIGYLGDGINDAPSLKVADVGISVHNAADIAKESASIILLRKSLRVLEDGVLEGRKTFGNIIKYIKMGSSSNFGNMFSLTGASIFLPFLPMTPIQILLNNFLYDLSQVAIPTDNVDPEYLKKSRPWNISSIKRFMIVFGPISSVFDFITFWVLLNIFRATESTFHTSWFLFSLITQTLVIHIIRTSKIPFVQSRPSRFLLLTSIVIVLSGIIIPLSPLDKYFKFAIPNAAIFLVLTVIIISYLITAQVVKSWFIRKWGYD